MTWFWKSGEITSRDSQIEEFLQVPNLPRPSVCLGHLAVVSSPFCSLAAFQKWIPIASSLTGQKGFRSLFVRFGSDAGVLSRVARAAPALSRPGQDSVAVFLSAFVNSQKLLRSPRKPTRKISKIPFKVLDAPELQDDFYLNLVDWSSLNVLSVGLGTCVYLWSACTSQVNGPQCLESEVHVAVGLFQLQSCMRSSALVMLCPSRGAGL